MDHDKQDIQGWETRSACEEFRSKGFCKAVDKCLGSHYGLRRGKVVFFPNIYEYTTYEVALLEGLQLPKKDLEMCIYQFDMAYRALFSELLRFGKVTEMVMCDNLYDPLRGSLYVVYDDVKAGEKCRKLMSQRFYDGKPVKPIVIAGENLDHLLCPSFIKGSCSNARCTRVHTKFVTTFIRKLLAEKAEKQYAKPKA